MLLRRTDGGFGDEDGVANGTIVDPLIPVSASSDSVPQILIQPVNQSVSAGATASSAVSAIGNQNPSAQWEESTNHGKSWTHVLGATNPIYLFATLASENDGELRAEFSNGIDGTVISNTLP